MERERERERVTNGNTRNKTACACFQCVHPHICTSVEEHGEHILVSDGMKTGRARADFIEWVRDQGQPKLPFAGNQWSYKINLSKHTQIFLDLFAAI